MRVFDGAALSGLTTVVIEDGLISARTTADEIFDGQGQTLLAGLIDAHVHLGGIDTLREAARWGVTTMLDMASPAGLVDGLRGLPALPDIRSSCHPASAPGGLQTTRMGFPRSSAISEPGDAEPFVAQQQVYHADYIKLILEDPAAMGPAAITLAAARAVVDAAHRRRLKVYAHAANLPAFQLGIDAGVDVLTHMPLEAPLPPTMVKSIKEQGIMVIPTLVMMKGIASRRGPGEFANALASVRKLLNAGVPVMAGTDANIAPGAPFNIPHGAALHEELALLSACGMSFSEAISSATSVPAQCLDLADRGIIKAGSRADLFLVKGDPTLDISFTKAIQAVWIGGARVHAHFPDMP